MRTGKLASTPSLMPTALPAPMNVFYEEDGGFKVGGVIADNTTSLQVEAPHGKRAKIKSAQVLLRFGEPALAEFMGRAQSLADEIDIDFLWQCSPPEEFGFEPLAREYFGRTPSALESAALLIRLHGAPMYFYKKGKGRYKAAPEDALRAALASVERKRLQAQRQAEYVAQLAAFKLPAEFAPLIDQLLYRPDRAGIESKALDEACAQLRLTPARLLQKCGALESEYDYHLKRFLFEHFPGGAGFPPLPALAAPADLAVSDAAAFSIDDATTTEIDDAFSVTMRNDGGFRVGIYIAAPALGIAPDSPIDAAARARLSTVYMPGGKITMLPQTAIDAFTLHEAHACPALSIVLDLAADCTVRACQTRLERVEIAANLRHDALEQVFNEDALERGHVDHPYGRELTALWRFATQLEALRGAAESGQEPRIDYSFYVEDGRVRIAERRRGSPIDKVVSELMIYVNTEWGRQLAEHGFAAIYRSQAAGKVKMSTVAAAHQGLGVDQYAWASSPLRRYVDLVNQRQLIAMLRGEAPVYARNDERLLGAMRDFELAYDAYAQFQRHMERYWCLRWLLQEGVSASGAAVVRDNLVRLDRLPLVVRVPSLPELPAGSRVEVEISAIDLMEVTLHCEYRQRAAA